MVETLTITRPVVPLVALAMLAIARADAGAQPIEARAGAWAANASIVAASGAPGVPGTPIDFTNGLGMTGGWLPDFAADISIAARHTLRLEYLHVADDGAGALAMDVFFSGVRFPAGTPLRSTLGWHAYRIGYAYEFARWTGGALGVVVDFRGNDVTVTLASAQEAASRATSLPLPAFGVRARHRIAPRVLIGGELTGFAVPENDARTYGGHFVDGDAYVDVSLSAQLGIRAGFRDLDTWHLGESDSGTLVLKGAYVAASFRF